VNWRGRKAHNIEFNKLILDLLGLHYLVILGDLNADLMATNINPGAALLNSLKLAGTSIPHLTPTRITATSATCLDLIHCC